MLSRSNLPPTPVLLTMAAGVSLCLVLTALGSKVRTATPKLASAAEQEPLQAGIRAVPPEPAKSPDMQVLEQAAQMADTAAADTAQLLEKTKELAADSTWFGFARLQTAGIEKPWRFTLYSWHSPALRVGDRLLYEGLPYIVIATGLQDNGGRVYHILDASRSPEDFKLAGPLHPEAKAYLVDEKNRRVEVTDIVVPQ